MKTLLKNKSAVITHKEYICKMRQNKHLNNYV